MKNPLLALGRFRQSALARNAGWMFAGQVLSVICQAIYFLLIGRLLGTREYGIYVGAVAMVAIVSQYSSLGSHSVFLRYISADRTDYRYYWGNILFTTLTLGSIFVVLLTLFGPHFAPSYSARMVFYVAMADCICAQLTFAIGRVFQAFERMAITAGLSLLVNVLRAILASVLLVSVRHSTAMQWSGAVLIVSATAAVLALITVLRLYGGPSFSWSFLRKRMGEGSIFALSYSTTGIYNDIDKALLGHNGMNTANGVYTMAYRVIDVGTMPILSVQNAAFPTFFRKGAEGIRQTQEYCIHLLKKTSLLGVAMCAGLFLFAPIIPRLVGNGFAESVSVLRWLCLLPLFRSVQLAAGDAITAAGHQKLRLAAQAVAAGFNLVANLYFIPRYSWRGAAGVSVATDALLALSNWLLLQYLAKRLQADEPVTDKIAADAAQAQAVAQEAVQERL